MATLAILLLAANVVACSMMALYFSARARGWWPFRPPVRRPSKPSTPLPSETVSDDYVRRGLEDLMVMLAQAARRSPS